MHAPSIRTAPHGRRTTPAACSPPGPRSAHSAVAAPATAGAQVPPSCATDGAIGLAYAKGVNCRTSSSTAPRRFLVYVPTPRRPGRPRPVVFMFHGSRGTGEQFLAMSGWREQADATGLVAVFPTGLRYRVLDRAACTKWNASTSPSRSTPKSARRLPAERRARRRRRLRRHDMADLAPNCRSTAAACTPPASPTARASRPACRRALGQAGRRRLLRRGAPVAASPVRPCRRRHRGTDDRRSSSRSSRAAPRAAAGPGRDPQRRRRPDVLGRYHARRPRPEPVRRGRGADLDDPPLARRERPRCSVRDARRRHATSTRTAPTTRTASRPRPSSGTSSVSTACRDGQSSAISPSR